MWLTVFFSVLWGLDDNGSFKTGVQKRQTLFSYLLGSTVSSEKTDNVHQAVLADLKAVDEQVQVELAKYPPIKSDENEQTASQSSKQSRKEISQRLLFLFQCDLLPGISGEILQSKSQRDNVSVPPVSRWVNIAGCFALFMLNFGMLFYIFLFALRQTSHRQSAWFQSFILWLIVEILFVSTSIVLFTHILIPMIAMKDVTKIKKRLLDSIKDFNGNLRREQQSAAEHFNAAKYLFVSTRLAAHYPTIKAAAIIRQFNTPWPKKSYQHYSDVSKAYNRKFSAISRSLSLLLMFFVTNLLNVPPTLQDMVIHMVTTTTIGYTILLHIELFYIFPVLAFVPFVSICLAVHFYIQYDKQNTKKKLARLLPVSSAESKKDDAVDSNNSPSNHRPVGGGIGGAAAHQHVTRRQSVVKGLSVVDQLQDAVAVERKYSIERNLLPLAPIDTTNMTMRLEDYNTSSDSNIDSDDIEQMMHGMLESDKDDDGHDDDHDDEDDEGLLSSIGSGAYSDVSQDEPESSHNVLELSDVANRTSVRVPPPENSSGSAKSYYTLSDIGEEQ